MKSLIVLILCVLAAQGQAAWLFGFGSDHGEQLDENAIVTESEAVSQECLDLAAQGQCAFYECMERRFSCGRQGYNQRISSHFCSKIEENFDEFDEFMILMSIHNVENPNGLKKCWKYRIYWTSQDYLQLHMTAGQLWLNRTSICLVSHMLPIYRDQTTTTCGDIKAAGIQGIVDCNAGIVNGHGFCHFLNTNGDQYKALMGSPEVGLLVSLRDRRVFQSMISSTVRCSFDNFREFAASATQRFMSMMGSLWNSIWGQ